MSVYSYLSTPAPRIAYCAIHQALPEIGESAYVDTMQQFHRRIADESDAFRDGYSRFVGDAAGREVQTIRSLLSEFLQTPLRTDEEEIRLRISESLERFRESIQGNRMPGLRSSNEGKVSTTIPGSPAFQRGNTYLKELGFDLSKRPEIFESVFEIEGGENLDILEHIVRDRLGIYGASHGRHIKEFSGYAYSMYNLVCEQGVFPYGPARAGCIELALFFSKPGPDVVKYAPFRKALVQAMERLVSKHHTEHVSVWQRKLGLGAGVEFVLRVLLHSSTTLEQVMQELAEYDESSVVRDVANHGSALIKQILF